MKKRIDGDHGVLIESNDDDDDDHDHRDRSLSPFNQWPYIFNLANCIVGVSILAMPHCFQKCGILLGTILIAACSLLTKVTCHLLYQGAVMTRRRSYEAMAFYCFGSKGRRLIELLMVLFLMSSVVSYMVVIGDIGPHILADYLELRAPTQRLRILTMVLVFLFVVLPLSLVRSLDSLSGMSSVTVFFYGIFVFRMLFECIPRVIDGEWSTNMHWWRQEGLLTSLPIISMALTCQTQLFCVVDSVKDATSTKVDTIVSGSVNICSGMYAAVGIFGYVAFYDIELHGDILLYLQSSFITQMLKLAFLLSVAVSIPLTLFPSRIAFYNLLSKKEVSEFVVLRLPSLTFVLLTVFLLTVSLFIAITIPNVEFILAITGAFIGSLVTIIIPSILFISICPVTEQNKSLIIYAKISLIVGSLMLIASTWAVLQTKQESNVVDVILPRELDSEKVEDALKQIKNHKVEHANTTAKPENFPSKIRSSDDQKAAGDDAQKILREMKEQQKEQGKILKEQQAIVDELKKHHEMHLKVERNERGISNNRNSTVRHVKPNAIDNEANKPMTADSNSGLNEILRKGTNVTKRE